jgi:hypothetical protein
MKNRQSARSFLKGLAPQFSKKSEATQYAGSLKT